MGALVCHLRPRSGQNHQITLPTNIPRHVYTWRGSVRNGANLFGQLGQKRGEFFGGQAPFKAGGDDSLAID